MSTRLKHIDFLLNKAHHDLESWVAGEAQLRQGTRDALAAVKFIQGQRFRLISNAASRNANKVKRKPASA